VDQKKAGIVGDQNDGAKVVALNLTTLMWILVIIGVATATSVYPSPLAFIASV